MARGVSVRNQSQKVIAQINQVLKSYAVLSQIATFMRERIYQNTKRGYYAGVRKNLAKLKPLSPFYIKYRESLLKDQIKAGTNPNAKRLPKSVAKSYRKFVRKQALKKFGPFFSPKKSNLTFTGQMLEALDSKVDRDVAVVFVQSSSRDDDSGLTNAQVAEKVIREGRPFLRLDDKGVDRIRRAIISNLRRSLKRR